MICFPCYTCKGLPHLSPFKIPRHFPNKISVFRDNFFYFSICKINNFLTVIIGNSPTNPVFLKGKSLTVIINRPRVYICQVDICINTTQVEPLSCDGNFNLKMSWWNSLTWYHKIPWHLSNDQNSLTFFSKFPDLEKILFLPDISLTRGSPVVVSVHVTAFHRIPLWFYLHLSECNYSKSLTACMGNWVFRAFLKFPSLHWRVKKKFENISNSFSIIYQMC